MSDINIQTSAQTTLAWRRHGVDGDPWKSFGSDPSITDVSVDLDVDEQSDYGTRDVVNRELTGVSGSLGVDVTANHWWLTEHWLEEFADTPTDNEDGTFTWTGDGTEDYTYIDVRIGNTRSGEDYIFERCASDVDVSMSSPYGGGDNTVDLSFTLDASWVYKESPTEQDTEPEIRFEDADPLYFKNSRVSTPTGIDSTYVLTEFSFSVSNDDEGVSQIPVVNNGEVTGGLEDVTRSPGSRDIEVDRTILRNDEDEEFDRILDDDGRPDGAQDPEYDLEVTIGNSIVDGSEITGVDEIHEITFSFTDLFPTDFSWSGFDDRGGDISQDLSDGATGLTAEYRVGTDTRP